MNPYGIFLIALLIGSLLFGDVGAVVVIGVAAWGIVQESKS